MDLHEDDDEEGDRPPQRRTKKARGDGSTISSDDGSTSTSNHTSVSTIARESGMRPRVLFQSMETLVLPCIQTVDSSDISMQAHPASMEDDDDDDDHNDEEGSFLSPSDFNQGLPESDQLEAAAAAATASVSLGSLDLLMSCFPTLDDVMECQEDQFGIAKTIPSGVKQLKMRPSSRSNHRYPQPQLFSASLQNHELMVLNESLDSYE